MPRGGKRSGTPGVAYGNRSDLNQAPRAATGQTYGEAGKQLASQQVAPLPETSPSLTLPPPIDRPSERPGEPVTSGAPVGPGPGMEALGMAPAATPEQELRALYAQYPNEDLRALIEEIEGGGFI